MSSKKTEASSLFDLRKVERGIRVSTEKLRISAETIDRLLNAVEDEVQEMAGHERRITSRDIGEATLRQLYKVSKVAYVRFAAVYREFNDLDNFIAEIENIASSVSS